MYTNNATNYPESSDYVLSPDGLHTGAKRRHRGRLSPPTAQLGGEHPVFSRRQGLPTLETVSTTRLLERGPS